MLKIVQSAIDARELGEGLLDVADARYDVHGHVAANHHAKNTGGGAAHPQHENVHRDGLTWYV